MIIHSSLIKLEYEPSSDILSIEWPSSIDSTSNLYNATWDEVINTIRYYDIKHLLIDSRKLMVNALSEEYKAMVFGFGDKLKGTRLEKLARVETLDKHREQKIGEFVAEDASHIYLQSFANISDAFKWLGASKKEVTE